MVQSSPRHLVGHQQSIILQKQAHYNPCSVGTSLNGWTDDLICTKWFEHTFIPQATARNEPGKPILLIYDGHGSHIMKEMCQLAIKNNIELFCLPLVLREKLLCF